MSSSSNFPYDVHEGKEKEELPSEGLTTTLTQQPQAQPQDEGKVKERKDKEKVGVEEAEAEAEQQLVAAPEAKPPKIEVEPIDDKDYVRRYTQMRKDVDKDSIDPTKYMLQLEMLITDLLNGNCALSEEHQNYFLDVALPAIVVNLSTRSFRGMDEPYLLVNKFFAQVLQLVCHFMDQDRLPLLNAFSRIFDEDCRFYFPKPEALFAKYLEQRNLEDPIESYLYVLENSRAPKFFTYLVDYFGYKGGFARMLNRIAVDEPGKKVPVACYAVMSGAVSKVRVILRKEAKKEIFPPMEERAFQLLLHLTDAELRNVKQDEVKQLFNNIDKLINEYSNSGMGEQFEMNWLDFSLKCFKSPQLEKRAMGMSFIEDAISMARRKKYNYLSSPRAEYVRVPGSDRYVLRNRDPPPVARWLTCPLLVDWIRDNEIVKNMMDHRELIKRSKGIVQFLAQEKSLAEGRVLDALWEAAQDESLADAVYELLGNICLNLDEKTQMYLLEKINSVPFSQITPRTISLLLEMSNVKEAVLKQLWDIIQDDSGASAAVAEFALDQLIEKTAYYAFKSFFPIIMELCILGIKERRAVPQCILLLHEILSNTRHYPKKESSTSSTSSRWPWSATKTVRENEPTRQSVVNDLLKKYDLPEILIASIEEYKKASFAKVAELKQKLGETSEEPINDSIFVGRYPHLKQITLRLDFLRFILDNSEARLSASNVDVLWGALIDNENTTREERQIALYWFYEIANITEKDGSDILDGHVILHIFQKMQQRIEGASSRPRSQSLIFDNLEIETEEVEEVVSSTETKRHKAETKSPLTLLTDMGLVEFNGFARYFCCVNLYRDSLTIQSIHLSGKIDLKVINFDNLVGLNCLWLIALNADAYLVSRAAMEFLVQLHFNVDNNNQDVNAIQQQYISTCMSQLQQCQSSLVEKAENKEGDHGRLEANQINRLVLALKIFLDEYKKRDKEEKKRLEQEKEKEEEEKANSDAASSSPEIGPQPQNKQVSFKADEPLPKRGPPQIPTGQESQVEQLADMFGLSKLVVSIAMEKNLWDADKALNLLLDDASKQKLLEEATEREQGGDATPLASEQAPSLSDKGKEKETPKPISEEDKEEEDTTEEDPPKKAEAAPTKPQIVPPTLILANNQEYFDQLFQLLNLESIDRAMLWVVLRVLPINEKMLETFKHLPGEEDRSSTSPDWDGLLDPRSMYKLLYNLKIINLLMSPSESATEEEIAEKDKWCRQFFYASGFHHLFNMLASCKRKFVEQENISVFKSCLKYLLKIVHYFFKGGLKEQCLANIPTTPFGKDPGALVPSSQQQALPPGAQEIGTNNKRARNQLAFSARTGKSLIDSVDFPFFVQTMIQLTWDTCKSSEYHRSDVSIIKYAMSLLVASIASRPDLLVYFYHFPYDDGSKKKKQRQECGDGEKGTPSNSHNKNDLEIESFIVSSVIHHPDSDIRQAVVNGLYQLATELSKLPAESLPAPAGKSHGTPHSYLLELLLANLPAEGAVSHTCQQYFEFLSQLISEDIEQSQKNSDETGKYEGLLRSLVRQIQERTVQEAHGDGSPDHILIGMMKVLATLLHYTPAMKIYLASAEGGDLLGALWQKYLFPAPEPLRKKENGAYERWKENAKCKTPKSREMALNLLLEFARDCPDNLRRILRFVFELHEEQDTDKKAPIERPMDRNISGYVGLRNPGCICYMNSLLQQIFMNPTLRYGLLSAKVSLPPIDEKQEVKDEGKEKDKDGEQATNKPTTTKEEDLLADNVLYQLQIMFGHLMQSQNQYYDPTSSFCKAFKDRMGQPVSLYIQEDASEFVYTLFARLEDLLKGTEHEKLLHNFTGKETQIVRCNENPEHFSESEHPVSLVTVPVRGVKDLNEALEHYVEGDKLDDWKCEDCNTVVGAVKRTCYKHLSNTLIIHLKRFDYSIDAMGDIKQFKVTDRFEFPLRLNMEPFTAEGLNRKELIDREKAKRGDSAEDVDWSEIFPRTLPESYYQYELVGILVHTGSQEAGHYYSYIKERTKSPGNWYEFNDAYVTPWDIKNVARECFGGEKTPNSAYILFYQRIVPEPEVFPIPEAIQTAQRNVISQQLSTENGSSSPSSSSSSSPFIGPLPATPIIEEHESENGKDKGKDKAGKEKNVDPLEDLFSEVMPETVLKYVWKNNHKVMRSKHMYQQEYIQFLANLFGLVPTPSTPVLEVEGKLEEDESFRLIHFATRMMDTLVRNGAEDEKLYKTFMSSLVALYKFHVPACRWFLSTLANEQKKQWFQYHLIDTIHQVVREGFAGLIVSVLSTLSQIETETLRKEREERKDAMLQILEEEEQRPPLEKEEKSYNHSSTTSSVNFIEYMIENMEGTRRAWRRFQQYFWIFHQFAELGYEQRMYLIDRGMIGILVDFYMGEFSPYWTGPRRVHIGEVNRVSPNLETFMDAFAAIMRSVETPATKALAPKRPPTAWPDDPTFAPLHLKSRRLLFNKPFFESMMKQGYNHTTNNIVTTHLSWEDEERSYFVLSCLFKEITEVDAMEHVFPVLTNLLRMKDSLQHWRIELTLNPKEGGILSIMKTPKGDKPSFVFATIHFMMELANENKFAASYLRSTQDLWWPDLQNFLTKKRTFTTVYWEKFDKPQAKLQACYDQVQRFLLEEEEEEPKETEEQEEGAEKKGKEKEGDAEKEEEIVQRHSDKYAAIRFGS
ncbi:Ubiquitin carboxyl-terminal hydrolase [Balamuthia mandrillaris]